MRHQKTRHKLSRDAAHRKAMLANLCVEVIDHERIKTTQAKAKAVKPELEKLITLAKKGDLHARRQERHEIGVSLNGCGFLTLASSGEGNRVRLTHPRKLG